MISYNITIPENCHIIINGIDYAGWDVHHMFHHPDGTGEFVVDYKVDNRIVQQKIIFMNKQQNLDMMIAMAEDRIRYNEEILERDKLKLIELLNQKQGQSITKDKWKTL
jgi:hypothetical protein